MRAGHLLQRVSGGRRAVLKSTRRMRSGAISSRSIVPATTRVAHHRGDRHFGQRVGREHFRPARIGDAPPARDGQARAAPARRPDPPHCAPASGAAASARSAGATAGKRSSRRWISVPRRAAVRASPRWMGRIGRQVLAQRGRRERLRRARLCGWRAFEPARQRLGQRQLFRPRRLRRKSPSAPHSSRPPQIGSAIQSPCPEQLLRAGRTSCRQRAICRASPARRR